MSARSWAKRAHGQMRQSQLITTFGPGAMVDLPNHSVLIGGLDHWSPLGEEIRDYQDLNAYNLLIYKIIL